MRDYRLVFWAAILFLSLALPAEAHSRSELDDWVDDWQSRFLSHGAMAEWEDMALRHPWYFAPAANPVDPASGGGVYRGMGTGDIARWEPVILRYFDPAELPRVVCLIAHESGGNPDARNPSSGARGLLQVMPFWAAEFGFTPDDLYDPHINLLVSSRIRTIQGWTAWAPYNRGECR